MLSQAEVERLLATPKRFRASTSIDFPLAGDSVQLEVVSSDERDEFEIDINRRGRIKISKCTFQERYAVVEILLRLDIDGPPHTNPDGEVLPCPHLHVYRENYGDKWAMPLPPIFTDPTDLMTSLKDFLRHCNLTSIPPIQKAIV